MEKLVETAFELHIMQKRLTTNQPVEAGKHAFAQRSQDQLMLIRYGYELTFKCPQPTMMVCLLDAHRERSQELRYEIPPTTIPTIPTTTYLDTFGNTARRFMAPPGDLTIRSDAVIEDSGMPDPVKLDAGENPRTIAERNFGVFARQPLLRNRQARRHRLVPFRIKPARMAPGSGDLRFCLRSFDLRLRIRPSDPHRF